MNYDQMIQTVLDCGATKAAVVGQENIVLNTEFRGMCEVNRCGVYNRCYMCPPDIGPAEALMAKVRSYDRGILYQTINELEDSFDFEGMTEAKKRFVQVNQRVLDALKPVVGEDALFLGGGGCGLCEVCAKITGEPCRFPDRAMSSVEGYCMDVYNTTKTTPLKYINGANTVTYFGIVLFMEKENG